MQRFQSSVFAPTHSMVSSSLFKVCFNVFSFLARANCTIEFCMTGSLLISLNSHFLDFQGASSPVFWHCLAPSCFETVQRFDWIVLIVCSLPCLSLNGETFPEFLLSTWNLPASSFAHLNIHVNDICAAKGALYSFTQLNLFPDSPEFQLLFNNIHKFFKSIWTLDYFRM